QPAPHTVEHTGSLLGSAASPPPRSRTYFAAGIEELYPSPEQPRRRFDETKLAELAESMKAHGVIVPLVVRPRPDGGDFLMAGGRRLLAGRGRAGVARGAAGRAARGSGRRPGGGTGHRAGARAGREPAARRPRSARGGRSVPAAGRRVRVDPGGDRRADRQGPQ